MGKIYSKETNNILLLGPKNSGKTTLILNMISQSSQTQYQNLSNTYGFNIETLVLKKKNYNFIEFGGDQNLDYFRNYFIKKIEFNYMIIVLGVFNYPLNDYSMLLDSKEYIFNICSFVETFNKHIIVIINVI